MTTTFRLRTPVRHVLGALALAAAARGEGLFRVVPMLEVAGGTTSLVVTVDVPAGHRLYAEEFRVQGRDGTELGPLIVPPPVRQPDPVTGEVHPFHGASFTARCEVVRSGPQGVTVEIEWLGCDQTQCFLPERLEWRAGAGGIAATQDAAAVAGGFALPPDFRLVRTHAGYAGERQFLDFLAGRLPVDDPARSLLRRGWLFAVMLILGGGVALNLTPCVLPMIPINLALIGAGAQRSGSRARGALLGAAYGAGMCAAYGLLGVVVVLGGAPFGAINASPWFNATIALLFTALAAAMAGRLNLDFSRWQSRVDAAALARRRVLGVFALGGLSAVLAGACVAPVLVSVLLLAAALYQQGHTLALGLPFLLGLGMALPWPLAGAGLARLPKPGPWMDRVKYGFAVFIAAVALYYARLAWIGFAGPGPASTRSESWAEFNLDENSDAARWAEVFSRARASGRPVLVDLWATWCKNCAAMERTTLRRPAVRSALRRFVTVKYAAERPAREPARSVLAVLGARGLPTYAVLEPTPPR
ncbi:MAG: thioredoxin family protein [Kiritimatiellae bacterium]|nr:thioredoxin family protein [Kiritimatiellia bacterium]